MGILTEVYDTKLKSWLRASWNKVSYKTEVYRSVANFTKKWLQETEKAKKSISPALLMSKYWQTFIIILLFLRDSIKDSELPEQWGNKFAFFRIPWILSILVEINLKKLEQILCIQYKEIILFIDIANSLC